MNTIHDIKDLGKGFCLGREDDGAFWLIPPKDVTVFSEAGEPLLLVSDQEEDALAEALSEIDERRSASNTSVSCK